MLKNVSKRDGFAAIALCAATLGAATLAWASADTSPKPGGVYRLKPGIYVADDAQCEAPPNVAIRLYDGKGISTAHTRACKATVKSRRKSTHKVTFTVEQSCIDAGSGPGKRFTQRQKVVVQDALTFTQVIGRDSTMYRYCPIYQLPKGLQGAAQQQR